MCAHKERERERESVSHTHTHTHGLSVQHSGKVFFKCRNFDQM